jgi:hypothetical protein
MTNNVTKSPLPFMVIIDAAPVKVGEVAVVVEVELDPRTPVALLGRARPRLQDMLAFWN